MHVGYSPSVFYRSGRVVKWNRSLVVVGVVLFGQNDAALSNKVENQRTEPNLLRMSRSIFVEHLWIRAGNNKNQNARLRSFRVP